ncbi:hypothetical protein SGLAM104S_08269 [Streptomyces glaucescens]
MFTSPSSMIRETLSLSASRSPRRLSSRVSCWATPGATNTVVGRRVRQMPVSRSQSQMPVAKG